MTDEPGLYEVAEWPPRRDAEEAAEQDRVDAELLTAAEWEARKLAEVEAEQARIDAEMQEFALQNGQLYKLEIIATGEVRDADGNLLNQDVTAAGTYVVTEAQALGLLEQHGQQ